MLRRLQRMDVDVYRLTEPLEVSDFHAYGDPEAERTLPAGTYWIPMAQGQKHWIQSMLHEDTYMPYKVTYDVTAWSNPMLMNVRGGYSDRAINPDAARARRSMRGQAWTHDQELCAASRSLRSRIRPEVGRRPGRRAICSTTSGISVTRHQNARYNRGVARIRCSGDAGWVCALRKPGVGT